MTISKQPFEEDQKRLMTIKTIGIEVKALALDGDTNEVIAVDDSTSERLFYASVFRAWAENRINGTADQIFETIQEALEI